MKKNKIIFWSVIAGGTILAVYLLTKKPKAATASSAPVKAGDTATKADGTAIQIVDAAGDYMEISDPTTLYDINGNVIGNLNDYTHQFESPTGAPLAAAQGVVAESSFIGKAVNAKSYNTYVRGSAGVINDVIYNNIVGVLAINEQAGIVNGTSKDGYGNVWLSVARSTDYNCPFGTCGFHLNNNSGWVSANDVVAV